VVKGGKVEGKRYKVHGAGRTAHGNGRAVVGRRHLAHNWLHRFLQERFTASQDLQLLDQSHKEL
jgi:hypothetical protein